MLHALCSRLCLSVVAQMPGSTPADGVTLQCSLAKAACMDILTLLELHRRVSQLVLPGSPGGFWSAAASPPQLHKHHSCCTVWVACRQLHTLSPLSASMPSLLGPMPFPCPVVQQYADMEQAAGRPHCSDAQAECKGLPWSREPMHACLNGAQCFTTRWSPGLDT